MRPGARGSGGLAPLVLALVLTPVLALALSGCGGESYDGLGDLPLPGGVDVGDDPLRVTLESRDVLNLARGATVKVDDVTVGEVAAIERVGWQAEVELVLRADVALPANAVAAVRQTGLLGEKYVELAPPATERPRGRLADGDVIGTDRSGRSFEVEEVLSTLSLLLNGGGLENLRTITVELHDAFEGREPQLRSLLRNADTSARLLASNRRHIDAALDGLDALSSELADGAEVVDRALTDLPAAVRTLADQRRGLVRMLAAMDRLSTVGTRTVRSARADLVAVVDALQPTLTRLAEAGEHIPQSLEFLLSYPFPESAMSSVKGDYVNFAAQYALRVSDLVDLFRSVAPRRLLALAGRGRS